MPNPWRDGICVECGKPFRTRAPKAKTCGHRCGARMRERNTPSTGRKKVTYPPELVTQVRTLYEAGNSMAKVAAELGTTVKILQRLMPREGIQRRHPDGLSYHWLHKRVAKARGKPSLCEHCGRTDGIFEWANATGHYEDVNDYLRLCKSCHAAFDAARRKESGESTIPPHLRGRK